jgi:hypothetical protein
MQIEERALISGLIRTLNLPVTEDQIEAWENGSDIQIASKLNTLLENVDIKSDIDYNEGIDYFSD